MQDMLIVSQQEMSAHDMMGLMCRYGPTIALVFVLAVAAIKAIVEDKKRHDEDRKTNNTTAHQVLEDGDSRFPLQLGLGTKRLEAQNFPLESVEMIFVS